MFAAHFLQVVIDDHITPLLGQSNPNFSGLLAAIIQMAIIYLIGIIAGLTYNFMMVKISEGTQKKSAIRCSNICKNYRLVILMAILMVI